MPQQINLCTPILLTQKQYFSAQTMLQALAVFGVLGGGLCAYWVWSLNLVSDDFKKTLATQARELESLQVAMVQGKAGGTPVDAALTKNVENRRIELTQREKLLHELQRGLFKPGWGHAARLELLAQSIPAPVWVTQVKADDSQLEVSGFTLETEALSVWVAKLAQSPLLQGQKLTTVRVENATPATVSAAGAAAAASSDTSAAAPAPRPVWSFNLVSAITKPAPEAGGKP